MKSADMDSCLLTFDDATPISVVKMKSAEVKAERERCAVVVEKAKQRVYIGCPCDQCQWIQDELDKVIKQIRSGK